MGNLPLIRIFLLAGALILPGLGSAQASSGGYCTELALSCEDGRVYRFCPIATSDQGEIVTGHLAVGPRRGVYVRLVPMGSGYRYIGRGVYFEGIRSQAVLYLNKSTPLSCTVVRG
jgi:hypothetical protein